MITEEGALQDSYGEFKNKLKFSARRSMGQETPRSPILVKSPSGSDKRKYLTSINKRYVNKTSPKLRNNMSQSSLTSKSSPKHIKNTSQMTFGDKRSSYQTFTRNADLNENLINNININHTPSQIKEQLFQEYKDNNDNIYFQKKER